MPADQIVTGGYSQGAAIAAYITTDNVPDGYALPAGITGPLPPNVANHVATVALFGKPSNGFLDLVDRNAPPITIGHLYFRQDHRFVRAQRSRLRVERIQSRRAQRLPIQRNDRPGQAADFAANAIKGGRQQSWSHTRHTSVLRS